MLAAGACSEVKLAKLQGIPGMQLPSRDTSGNSPAVASPYPDMVGSTLDTWVGSTYLVYCPVHSWCHFQQARNPQLKAVESGWQQFSVLLSPEIKLTSC